MRGAFACAPPGVHPTRDSLAVVRVLNGARPLLAPCLCRASSLHDRRSRRHNTGAIRQRAGRPGQLIINTLLLLLFFLFFLRLFPSSNTRFLARDQGKQTSRQGRKGSRPVHRPPGVEGFKKTGQKVQTGRRTKGTACVALRLFYRVHRPFLGGV
ncbi:hypothetical protein LZ31DRAFT_277031 [Colletotrichum somersetense]|nr:hypothetical protein LZ31DRAFT_277031 [Colletotrichum somersetense]